MMRETAGATMCRHFALLCLTAWLFLGQTFPLATCQAGTEYYFSALGNDQTGDGSQLNPWRTVDKFNSLDLEPGDAAFFRAGDTFNGSMLLDQNDTGVDLAGHLIAPITISSYGSTSDGRPIIRSSPTSAAFRSANNGGIDLSSLEFRNGGTYSSNAASAIEFRLNAGLTSSGAHIHHLRVDNVIAHGFHRNGLSLQSSVNIGYRDVQVSNSQFHDNQFAGIEIGASQWTDLIHKDVKIDNVMAYNNMGYNGCSPHCGHGIVVGQVDGALIENSVASSNGLVAGKGNVGIWAWQSTDVVIQRNQAFGNRSPSGGDGGGFDIDGGVTNSLVQYNMSTDNAGAGYLLAQFAFAEPMQQNTFRYNLSVNDGIDDYGGITVWGEDSFSIASSAIFHNNTVIVDKAAAPNSRGALSFFNANHSDVDLINNVFVALNGADLIDGPVSLLRAQFLNNAYWTDGAPVRIGESVYADIAAWAQATQQETLEGDVIGIQADPLFASGEEYRLLATSPLIDAGLPEDSSVWPSWWPGIGSMDLYGTALPQGSSIDLGAVEYAPLAGDFNADGAVDAADYVSWRRFNPELSEYEIWKSNFGQSIQSAGRGNASVPEPQSIATIVLATGLMWYAGSIRSVRKRLDYSHRISTAHRIGRDILRN